MLVSSSAKERTARGGGWGRGWACGGVGGMDASGEGAGPLWAPTCHLPGVAARRLCSCVWDSPCCASPKRTPPHTHFLLSYPMVSRVDCGGEVGLGLKVDMSSPFLRSLASRLRRRPPPSRRSRSREHRSRRENTAVNAVREPPPSSSLSTATPTLDGFFKASPASLPPEQAVSDPTPSCLTEDVSSRGGRGLGSRWRWR